MFRTGEVYQLSVCEAEVNLWSGGDEAELQGIGARIQGGNSLYSK